MYESYYGFREKPFHLTPDPKYLYLSQPHTEAFAHLEFGRRERGGFAVITGEVGTKCLAGSPLGAAQLALLVRFVGLWSQDEARDCLVDDPGQRSWEPRPDFGDTLAFQRCHAQRQRKKQGNQDGRRETAHVHDSDANEGTPPGAEAMLAKRNGTP